MFTKCFHPSENEPDIYFLKQNLSFEISTMFLTTFLTTLTNHFLAQRAGQSMRAKCRAAASGHSQPSRPNLL